MTKRVIVFAHFDKENIIADYVIFYLKSLRLCCDRLIFISTARLNNEELNKIKDVCDKSIVRENKGYDFYSWKVGIKSLKDLDLYDELVICNDSVYAPLFPLEKMFNLMEKRDCDFWGVTDNGQFRYHLQSYFVAFKKRLMRSNKFSEFWNNVKFENSKMDIIQKYEIGMTSFFLENGFKCSAYFKENITFRLKVFFKYFKNRYNNEIEIKKIIKYLFNFKKGPFSIGLNKLHYFWRELIQARIPILKIELIRDNPKGVNLKNLKKIIGKKTNYKGILIK